MNGDQTIIFVILSLVSGAFCRKREREMELEEEEKAKRMKEYEKKWDVSREAKTRQSYKIVSVGIPK